MVYDLGIADELLKQIEQRKWEEIPMIAILYHSYKVIEHKSEQSYYLLKQTLDKHWQQFEKLDLRDAYTILINHCIHSINYGSRDFLNELYLTYKAGLEHEIFMINGEMSRFTYKNIVSVVLQCGTYEEAKSFIETYRTYLPQDHQKDYFQYSKAKLAYSVQNYKRAIQQLQTLGSTDREVVMDGKGMLVKIYYMLQEYDMLDALLTSFKMYIKRDRYMSDFLKESYTNFVRYAQRLQRYNIYDEFERQELITAIQNEERLPERKWMLEQLKKKR